MELGIPRDARPAESRRIPTDDDVFTGDDDHNAIEMDSSVRLWQDFESNLI